jgi:hypothetical protein
VERTRELRLVDVLVLLFERCSVGGEFLRHGRFDHAKREWFETFLDLPNGIPSHDAFNRVFAALDPDSSANRFQITATIPAGGC